jgi:broad specificity phosphatase PhoE
MQASEIADRLPKLETLYSSNLERAKKTAQIIAGKHGLSSMNEVPELKEIVIQGVIGLPLDDVVQGKITPAFLPGDETFEELEERIVPTFQKIIKSEKGKTTGIVAHGHGIRLMILRLIEAYKGKLPSIGDLEQYNYLNPAEAWLLEWNEQGELVHQEILARPETKFPGKRHS